MDNLDEIFTDKGKALLSQLNEREEKDEDIPEEEYEPTEEAFIEVEPEDAEAVSQEYRKLRQIQMDMGAFLLQMEDRKEELLTQFRDTENHLN